MAINVVSVQYNGELLPDIMLLTQCYYHRGIRLNAMERFCLDSLYLCSHLLTNVFFVFIFFFSCLGDAQKV